MFVREELKATKCASAAVDDCW